MPLRVIAGSARGVQLQTPRGSATRPTSARLRESLFGMLEAADADLSSVLDLYAGSGALGIEALSRGAGRCLFVESDRRVCRVLRDNLERAGMGDRGEVITGRVGRWRPPEGALFTLVLADPPYDDGAAWRAIEQAIEGAVAPDALIAVEHSARSHAPAALGGCAGLATAPPGRRCDRRLSLSRRAGPAARGAATVTTAMYPGRFDPVTLGHLDIARRAASLYEELVVAVANSRSALFSTDERVALFSDAVADIPNARVIANYGLTVDCARAEGATVLVKGLRSINDFLEEFDMALMNRKMAPDVDSAFLMTSIEHLVLSASRVRELASFGLDVSDLVPSSVAAALREKFGDE